MTENLLGRRHFLKKTAQTALAAPILTSLSNLAAPQAAQKPAPAAPAKHPVPATPPKLKILLNVRDFGATGDGKTNDTVAIQETIDRCAVLGGGEVLVPAGDYSIGAIALRSNTLVRLEKDANLIGVPDFSAYPVTQVRWEGRWIQGHSALIYAIDAVNIGIVGPGKITGNHALGGRPNKDNPLRHPCVIEF